MTKEVNIGGIKIGAGNPIAIQSMCNTDSRDPIATLSQIRALKSAGCDIVRISVFDKDCVKALDTIIPNKPCPIVADIHFDYRLAIAAIEHGVDKLRFNPGNIGSQKNVELLCDCAKMHNVPIRIGVNSGSLEKEILSKYGEVCAEALVESALSHAKILENMHFYNIVLSMKASSVPLTVEAYRLASKRCDYPLHIGVTEAGLPEDGIVKSAVGLGTLLMEGIGDTMRVSLAGDPIPEVYAAKNILKACGLMNEGVDIIACPTCGRTKINLEQIAKQVKEALKDVKSPIKVAVMGCVVNGPGEAKEADIGIAGGGTDNAVLFKKGLPVRKITGNIAEELIKEIRLLLVEKESN